MRADAQRMVMLVNNLARNLLVRAKRWLSAD
jgi:hypothetical protein